MAAFPAISRLTIPACLKIQTGLYACNTVRVKVVCGYIYIIIHAISNLYYLLMRPPPGVKYNAGLRQAFPHGGNPVARVRQPSLHGGKPVARVRQPFPCGGKPVARVRQPSACWLKPITDVHRLDNGQGLYTRKFHVRYPLGFSDKNCNQY